MRRWGILGLGLLIGHMLATQVALWQYRHVLRQPFHLAPPWTIYRLWWHVGAQGIRPSLILGGGYFLLMCGLSCKKPPRTPQGARWATRRDLRRAGLFAPSGVVLGRFQGRVVRHAGLEHVLCVGPTRSGKGVGHVVPTLLDWPESVVVHDPKEELHAITAPWRATFSQVIHLHPTARQTDHYNPLAAVRLGTPDELRDAQLIAEILGDPDRDRQRGGIAEHFGELADALNRALILHGLTSQRATTLPALCTMLTGQQPFPNLVKEMRQNPHAAVQYGAAVVAEITERELSGVLTTTRRALDLFLDPRIAALTSDSSFALSDLRERVQPMSLYLSIPFADQERVRRLSRLILRQLLDYATQRLDGWAQRLLVLVDEVATLKRMPNLPEGLEFFAGFGVMIDCITPGLNPLDALYGVRNNFWEGSRLRLVFAPNSAGMASLFARETGEERITKRRTSRPEGVLQRGTVSLEETTEPLLSATALQQLPEDEVLLLVGNLPPARLKKIRYYAESPWQARSHLV